jgi:hypothetical protein
MHRLSLLILALALALYAVNLVAGSDPFTPFVLRDGLVIAGLSAILFGLYARPPEATWRPANQQIWMLTVIGIVAGAAFLRGWQLADLSPGCIAYECEQALQLAEGTGAPTLFNLLASAIYDMNGQALISLRFAGVFVGTLAVAIFFLTAMQYAGPAGALVATLLLAMAPWHIWSSRSGDPWLLYSLLLSALLGATAYIGRSRTGRWVASGIVVVLCALTLFSRLDSMPQAGAVVTSLLAVLLHGEESLVFPLFSGQALLGALPGALLFLGLGFAVRHTGRPRNLLLLSFLAAGVWVLGVDLTHTPAHRVLLVLLPFFFLFVALAADALASLAVEIWRILVQPRWLLAGAVAAILLVAGPGVLGLFDRLDTHNLAEPDAVEMAIGRYLAGQLQTQVDASTVYFAPAATLHHPTTRLLAGGALVDGQVLLL